jgi:DNA-binding response OmpR family regulator
VRLLFVENHRVFARTVTAEFLGAHDVVWVASVDEAVHQLDMSDFDALLVDYDLDDGKGDEIVRVARARQPALRIVADCSSWSAGCWKAKLEPAVSSS